MDPIERELREITRESPRMAEDLDDLEEMMRPPRGEMDVWGADEDTTDEDEKEDEDNAA